MTNQPAACLFNGQTVLHGQTVMAYETSQVGFGSQCRSQERVCNNGTLSGNFSFASCVVGQGASCLFDGQTIPNQGSVVAFLQDSVSSGGTCTSETRRCDNGTLSGSYNHRSCQVVAAGAAESCVLYNKIIPHGHETSVYLEKWSQTPGQMDCRGRRDLFCDRGHLRMKETGEGLYTIPMRAFNPATQKSSYSFDNYELSCNPISQTVLGKDCQGVRHGEATFLRKETSGNGNCRYNGGAYCENGQLKPFVQDSIYDYIIRDCRDIRFRFLTDGTRVSEPTFNPSSFLNGSLRDPSPSNRILNLINPPSGLMVPHEPWRGLFVNNTDPRWTQVRYEVGLPDESRTRILRCDDKGVTEGYLSYRQSSFGFSCADAFENSTHFRWTGMKNPFIDANGQVRNILNTDIEVQPQTELPRSSCLHEGRRYPENHILLAGSGSFLLSNRETRAWHRVICIGSQWRSLYHRTSTVGQPGYSPLTNALSHTEISAMAQMAEQNCPVGGGDSIAAGASRTFVVNFSATQSFPEFSSKAGTCVVVTGRCLNGQQVVGDLPLSLHLQTHGVSSTGLPVISGNAVRYVADYSRQTCP